MADLISLSFFLWDSGCSFFSSSVALSLRKRSMYLGLGLSVKSVARGQSETYASTQSQVLQTKGFICKG